MEEIHLKKKKTQTNLLIMYLCVLILICSTTGCFETLSNFDLDPVVMRANPYLKEIDLDNPVLQGYAQSLITNCDIADDECKVNTIYRHIVENYTYLADPEDEEIIQTPQETMQRKGGDCEDLTILLISLLENIDIPCYMVLTDTHAYALAIDIDTDSLWTYIEQSLISQVEKDNNKDIRQHLFETINLNRQTSWYYGGNGSNLSKSFESLTFTYLITSDRPIDIYLVPSKRDFNSFVNDTSFSIVSDCEYLDKQMVNDSCTMVTYGGIILSNDGFRPTQIEIEIQQYFKPSFYSLFKNNTISTYSISGKQSVVLDPTAGSYGYPGYDAQLTGEKIAFDPVTKEYVYLD